MNQGERQGVYGMLAFENSVGEVAASRYAMLDDVATAAYLRSTWMK